MVLDFLAGLGEFITFFFAMELIEVLWARSEKVRTFREGNFITAHEQVMVKEDLGFMIVGLWRHTWGAGIGWSGGLCCYPDGVGMGLKIWVGGKGRSVNLQ